MRFENIGQLLESRARQWPGKEFLFSEADKRVFTYEGFVQEVTRAAELLLSVGVTRGKTVSLLLTNSVEYLIFYFACFKIGAWAGPVNSLLKPHEIEFILNTSETGTVVTQPDLRASVAGAFTNVPSLQTLITIEADNHRAIETRNPDGCGAQPFSGVSAEDEAVIIYTSGTTGKPKGVLLSHGNILSNAEQISNWLGLGRGDRALMIMPLFHVNALMTTGMAALWAGGSIVLAPRFSASRHWQMISDFRATYFGSVATMLALLNNTHPEGVPPGLDTSQLRFALCGSAPVPVEVLKRFESLFKCPVVEGYGLSESTCRSTFNPPDERRKPGSVGQAIGNEIRIFDDKDRALGPREIGEIVLRGPNIMKGYYRDEAATREAFRSGWFHTGDLGYRDEDDFFYVVDRKSDMIIRAGENIDPREIDEVLYQHPKIKDAATVGIPDPIYGEEVRSFVVLRDGEQASEQEIIEFCRERLADFKCPKSILMLDDIPKGPTGKLLKRELGKM
jgi:acyl-CoA synthetase (AMP-forming)/AMP-acid ligase II